MEAKGKVLLGACEMGPYLLYFIMFLNLGRY